MKRLYWLFMAIFNPKDNDLLTQTGCWSCYLKLKGVDIDHDHGLEQVIKHLIKY